MTKKTEFSCGLCSNVWQKTGTTNCWSADPARRPDKPGYCPTQEHEDIIRESFDLYRGNTEDAKMARVATKVEGLCYQPVPGSDAVNVV